MSVLSKLPSFEVPLFQCGLVYLCLNHEDWARAHNEMDSDAQMLDRQGAANTFRNLDGGYDIYLLGVFDNNPSTLAHEAAHIVFDICSSVGIDVDRGRANETFCYLLEAIVEFAMKEIKGHELT